MKYFLSLVLVCTAFTLISGQDSLVVGAAPDTASNLVHISEINIEGNKKTRERIILRELTFKVGEAYDLSELEKAIKESKTNLLKQPLFNFVTIDKKIDVFKKVKIKIFVEERWFIWPQVHIYNNDRNFNTWWQTKDLSKLDYRLYAKQYNALGLNHILRIGISQGYTREFSVYYKNIAIGKKQHHFIGVGALYYQQKSAFYKNIDNKQESITLENEDALWGQDYKIEYSYRPRYKSKHGLILKYKSIAISDSIAILNSSFLANNQKENSYFEIIYTYEFDNRDSRGYPLHGNIFKFNIVKSGLGIFPEISINSLRLHAEMNQFYKFTNRFYGAHSFVVKKSLENEQPYFIKQGLGYKDFLRGFEYYVIEGEDYYLTRNTFKFELLPQRISNLKFIPIKKFRKIHYAIYLNTYFDLGFSHEKNEEIISNNDLSNKLIYSGGIGIDFATYYDKVFRIEYSINSLAEKGFFIHFKASI